MKVKSPRELSDRNYKEEQLVSELKITEQYKEIIETENKNLKN